MTSFRIEIDTTNDAFQPEPGMELARLLRLCADKLDDGERRGRLYDVNGNDVGAFLLVEEGR